MEQMNIDQISHSLALCGMSAYRQTLLDLVRRNNEIQEQVEELQNQLSSEIMARLLPQQKPGLLERQREVVEELGNGWRIERQPNDSQDVTVTTTAEDVDRQMTGVDLVISAFERYFVHSPGYPQDGDA